MPEDPADPEVEDVTTKEDKNAKEKAKAALAKSYIRWNILAKVFDAKTKEVGYFYGYWASRYPWVYVIGGFLFCIMFSVPFFMDLKNGMRGKNHPRVGLSLRTDVRVWLPSTSLSSAKSDIVSYIENAKDGHKQFFGQTVFRGRMATDAGIPESWENPCGGQMDDSEEVVLLYHHPNNMLCNEEQLKAVWEYENYIDRWMSSDGYAYQADFCEIDKDELPHFYGCGDYKGQDIGHPKCRRAAFDESCRTPTCLDYNSTDKTSGCSTLRPPPGSTTGTSRWCYIGKTVSNGTTTPSLGNMCYDGEAPMQTLCSDVQKEVLEDGTINYWSETACVAGAGVGTDQLSEADWCKPKMNVFNKYQSILKGAQYDVDMNDVDDFKLAFRGFKADDEEGPAICSLEGHPGKMCRTIKGARQEIPASSSNPLMGVFQMHQVFSTYFSNILLKATIDDTRLLKNCPRFNKDPCGDETAVVAKNVTLGAACADDDAGLVNLLTRLNAPYALGATCENAASYNWCGITDRKSSCSDVRSLCPLSCKNADVCPPDIAACNSESTSGCSSFATKETCPSGCSWHGPEIADRTSVNIGEGCRECDDSYVSPMKEWPLAVKFCCQGGQCSQEQAENLCKCFKDVNFCTLFGNVGREICPQQCHGACTRAAKREKCCTFSVADCATANDGGCVVDGTVCKQRPAARRLSASQAANSSSHDSENALKSPHSQHSHQKPQHLPPKGITDGKSEHQQHTEGQKKESGRHLAGTEVALDCDPSVDVAEVSCACDYTENSADARRPDIHKQLYTTGDCETIISTRKIRRSCELGEYYYKKMVHPKAGDAEKRPPPAKGDRAQYLQELMYENVRNWKDFGGGIVRGKMAPPDLKLYDLGIEVGYYSGDLFTQEVIEIVTSEIVPLIGTFSLMIIFVLGSIGVTEVTWIECFPIPFIPWRRALLCTLVVVQPVLATLMTWGLGSLPIWPVPGDIEEDGVEDRVLPLSILSPMFMHLMLAIIVDFDIILVRSFDRMCVSLPFDERLEKSMGYAHRTISLSMICGAIAFVFGAWVDLPILIYFCWQSFLGMLGLYITLFSIFLGFFVLAERGRHYKPAELKSRTSQVVLDYHSGVRRSKRMSKRVSQHQRASARLSAGKIDIRSSVHGTKARASVSVAIANARASERIRNSADDAGSIEGTDVGIKLLVVTNYNDLKLADLFGRWGVLYLSISIEVMVFLASCAIMWTTGMDSNVDTTKFLPDNSRVRWYTDKSREMGGTNDVMSLVLPNSDIGQFHIRENREYYYRFFDRVREHPVAKPTGIPGTYSWLTSFEMYHRGTVDDPVAVSPPNDLYQEYSTPLCSGCPLEQVLRNDAQLSIETVGDLALLDSVLLPQLTLKRKFNFLNTSIAEDDTENAWLRDLELGQVVNTGVSNFGGAWHDEVLYTQDPAKEGTSLREFGSPKELVEALKLVAVPFQLQFRSRARTKYRVERRLSELRQQCPLHESGYSMRTKYWDTHPLDFYEYLHDWFWDQKADWFEGSVCCKSELDSENSVLGKKGVDQNVPHATPYGPEEEMIQWKYNKTTLAIEGIVRSTLRVHIKWPTVHSQQLAALSSFETMLDKEILEQKEKWSSEPLDNFLYANNFVEATRDKEIPHYLTVHLQNVALGVVLVCMFFLHPIYGLAVGMFLAVINFQVIGVMTLFGIDIDVVAFGVITMAIGFEIEYVVHIAHAFMYQDSRGFHRMYDAQKEMGLTVFLAFLSTALQQLFFLVFTQGLSFRIYCGVMLLIIMKAGMTGFLLVPGVLGVLDERIALREFKEHDESSSSDSTSSDSDNEKKNEELTC